jgi:hypothetical protein
MLMPSDRNELVEYHSKAMQGRLRRRPIGQQRDRVATIN